MYSPWRRLGGMLIAGYNMAQIPDYFEERELRLPRSPDKRMIVGKCGDHPHPYERTVSITKEKEMERIARGMAPPRHCLNCERVLVKRVRVETNRRTNEVFLAAVAYGWDSSGYWCTRKCMQASAPLIAEVMFQIAGVRGDQPDPHLLNPTGLTMQAEYQRLSRQALNRGRKKFLIKV